jgi:cytochrome c-type biogenesis protein CcmE
MKKKNKRLFSVIILLGLFFLGCSILFLNLRNNLVFFYSPSEVFEKNLNLKKTIRVGGIVKEESVTKILTRIDGKNLEEISFIITDFNNDIEIKYTGILPDLFKEGQGVVVEGKIERFGFFKANKVLAKHDENYMPPEIKNLQSIKEKKNDI